MPTPYGSRGGMAFSAAELHVLRRSLAHALQSSTAPLAAVEVQACLRLAASVDDAVAEAERLRDFLLADLARYRDALPGSLSGYLELLQDALAAGYEPVPDDLAALRALRANPLAAAVLERAQAVAERSVRRRLRTAPAPGPACWPSPADARTNGAANRSPRRPRPPGSSRAPSGSGPFRPPGRSSRPAGSPPRRAGPRRTAAPPGS